MGYFPMQMNNTSGVCAVLRDAIHAADGARGRAASRKPRATKRQLIRKAMPCAGITATRGRYVAPGRHSAVGSGASYSKVCWSMSTRDKAERSSAQPKPCSWPRRSSVTVPRSTVYGGSVTSTSK